MPTHMDLPAGETERHGREHDVWVLSVVVSRIEPLRQMADLKAVVACSETTHCPPLPHR